MKVQTQENEDKASPAPKEEAAAQEMPAATKASEQEVHVPDIGDYSNVDVIEVNVSRGDIVSKEQPLITLETDKATMEVPSPLAGKILDIKVKEGDKVSQGDLIVLMQSEEGQEGQAPRPAPKETPQLQSPQKAAPAQETQAGSGQIYASPSVRRTAREFGINLSKVSPTGRNGRLTKEDVQNYVKSALQKAESHAGAAFDILPDPVVDFAKFGEVDTQPLSRIKKISGANLHRNWIRIPHITLFEEADITDLEAFRKAKKQQAEKAGIKLTPVPFLVKAIAKALAEHPILNASLTADGANLVMKKYIHVGVAVDTPNGLMVPVIRDADKKSIYAIAQDLLALIDKARKGQLKAADMQGGCFTISSLGGIGTTAFTPIVNMPEVGIMGVSKAAMKPIYDGQGGFVPRLMLPLSLSVDHRVVDGAQAGQFLVAVARYLSDLREILL